MGPHHHGMVCAGVIDGGDSLLIWRVHVKILNKQIQRANKGWSSSLGLGEELTIPHHKRNIITKCYTGHQTLTNSLEWPRQWQMDMVFETWNVRSLYRAGFLQTVASSGSTRGLMGKWWQSATRRLYAYGHGNANTQNVKAPGVDQILAEVIQAGGNTLTSEIHELINSVWNNEEMPQQWKEYTVAHIYTRVIKPTLLLQRDIVATSYIQNFSQYSFSVNSTWKWNDWGLSVYNLT